MGTELGASLPAGSSCTLSSPELAERRAWIAAEVAPLVRRVVRLPDGVLWECDGSAAAEATLRRWIEKERACCADVRFELGRNAAGDAILEVRGDDPVVEVLAGITPPASIGPRAWLRAGGIAGVMGFGVSFAVLCGLPMLVAALFGAAVAAPLARLESPATLTAGTLAVAGLIGVREWRRRRRPPKTAAAGDTSPCGC
ncbi:MAG: hypothetical protein AAF430_06340 [Myxococcota bacterium]